MLSESHFEDFLRSKMIDPDAFRKAEPDVWRGWKEDFEEMHPASFTVQKLNLINVIRRKYLLSHKVEPNPVDPQAPMITPAPAKPAKPVIKPRTN